MNYFLDTEFTDMPWNGGQLISIGLVKETGEGYGACLNDFDEDACSEFVKEYVLQHLPDTSQRKNREQVSQEIMEFVGNDVVSEIWAIFPHKENLYKKYGAEKSHADELFARYGDFDFQLLKSIFGNHYPTRWAQRCNNLTPIKDELKKNGFLPKNPGAHDALADAKWDREVWKLR